MKTLVLLSLVASLTIQAPRKVVKSFDIKYPSAEFVSWSFVDNLYEASFEHFDQQKTAIFTCDGMWTQTNVLLQPNELMFCIRDFLKHSYSSSRIIQVHYVMTIDLCEYHVLIETGENGLENKSETLRLIFDDNCEFMQNIDH